MGGHRSTATAPQLVRPGLAKRDWLLLLSIGGILLLLAISTEIGRSKRFAVNDGEPLALSEEIEISLSGCLSKPGKFLVSRGTTFGELLEQIVLLPEADLSQLPRNRRLSHRQRVHIPLRTEAKRERSVRKERALSFSIVQK
jgi:hypothetical protein